MFGRMPGTEGYQVQKGQYKSLQILPPAKRIPSGKMYDDTNYIVEGDSAGRALQ